MAITGLVLGLVFGGSGDGRSGSTNANGSAHQAQLSNGNSQQTVPSGDVPLGRGTTVIDFATPSVGWIVSGGADGFNTFANPTIVHTTDGGSTWHSLPVPNMFDQVVSYGTWFHYAGQVELVFADARHGWYLQGGLLWQTNDGGRHWSLVHLRRTVLNIAASDGNVWLIANTCPPTSFKNPCPTAYLYHRTLSGSTWHRYDFKLSSMSAGEKGGLVPEGEGVLVAGSPWMYSQAVYASAGGQLTVLKSSVCEPTGTLSGNQLVVFCDGQSSYVVPNDGKAQLLAQPTPSTPMTGRPYVEATNGVDVLFSGDRSGTLWRSMVGTGVWTPVFHTPPGSPDTVNPVFFASPETGFLLQSGGASAQFYITHDAGMTWQPMST